MATGSITVRAVEALAQGSVLWDKKVRGFGVRRQLRDCFFILKYRDNGRQRQITIGRFGSPWTPDRARDEAKRLLGIIVDGEDPAKPDVAVTLAQVLDSYLAYARASQRPDSFKETERHLRDDWAALHSTPLTALARRQVSERVNEIALTHPTKATNARKALSALLSWAIREGHAETNVVIGSNKPVVKARTRVLSDDELRRIWLACENDEYGRIVKLLMLTAQRREEIGGLRWSELDLDEGLLTLPPERVKNGSKTGRRHIVPLVPMAIDLLPPKNDHCAFVFGVSRSQGFTSWSGPKAELNKRCGINDWRIHDLRRSADTIMCDKLGVMPHVTEALLNHAKGGVEGIYNRARYLKECRRALIKWSRHIAKITR
jgi:integrase